MARNFTRQQDSRKIQRNLNSLQGRYVRDIDLEDYEDYEDYERIDNSTPRRFQHNTDDD